MGFLDGFGDSYSDAHAQVTGGHSASITHELLAAAASFEAAKKYEEHVAKNGKPDNHAMAKELLAGFTGAAVDHFAETKGLDFIDRQEAKHAAKKHAEERLLEEYGGQ